MKKIVLATLVAGAFLSSSAFAGTQVHGGKVNFAGEIISGACSIDSDSNNQTVKMNSMKADAFKTVGDGSGVKNKFTIVLRDCQTDSTVTDNVLTVAFKGTSDNTVQSILKNEASGFEKANNVGIAIYDSKEDKIDLGSESASIPFTDGNNTLVFHADYEATALPVTAGTVQAVADFYLTYN